MKINSTILKKYFVVTLGQVFIGIGCAFMVKSGMGNDPMGVMVSGLSKVLSIPYGTMNNIISLLIFATMFIFYRKRISFSTLITAVMVGWTIDPCLVLLGKINPPVLVNNIVYPLVGCVIISFGVAFYLCIDFGAGITDNLILFICDVAKKPYHFGCNLCYIIYFAIGFFTGGTWGFATLLTMVLNGRLIGWMMPKLKKSVLNWCES